jgi:hypothetical protein
MYALIWGHKVLEFSHLRWMTILLWRQGTKSQEPRLGGYTVSLVSLFKGHRSRLMIKESEVDDDDFQHKAAPCTTRLMLLPILLHDR